ncbi:FACT complex subunit [Hortaea werneckii]|nr:FACT complex subunit [Hortaea werneckii]KAI7661430.1 FACT complex subunit [Hortaea werneckii]
MARESFDDIYLDLSKQPGKCRVAESGLGWKPAGGSGGQTFTLDKQDIQSASWSRAARGYELKVFARNAGVVLLDGFRPDDYDAIRKCFQVWFGVELVQREHALRGWNWGKSELGRNELTFNVRNQPAFEIPYTEISNTNLAGKNEVAVELSLPQDGQDPVDGVNGTKKKGQKTGGAVDQLTEMRFYIPGTEMRKGRKKNAEDDGEEAQENGEEEENAANLFYEALMDKAEIGEVAGDTFATFLDILHLTPRGRFDIDLYEKSFRLRGKTYDYKISYDNAKRFFILPKPDDVHQLLCIGLDPPLRQGQTRYPFIVMQFKRDEEVNIELNMTEEDLKEKYAGKLQARYEASIGTVIARIFHGLTGKKLFQPSHDFSSHHQQSGVKCSIKANEGHLYCLDRAFLFVPKPATYISFDHVAAITMSRVGGAVSASRTFDITVTLKNGAGEHQFSNINREEQAPLENFFKIKNIKTKNEMDVENSMLSAALNGDADLGSSDDEEVVNAARGSAGEDDEDESVDEDFQADSDSDVAEEFDSDAKSSGGEESGSDEEMEDADADAGDGDDSDTAEKVERPKKKAKTGK